MRDLIRRAAGMAAAVTGASVLAAGTMVAAGATGAVAAPAMTAVEAVLPANAAAAPQVDLVQVSCASAGNCTAVGTYNDSSRGVRGLLLTETGGTWAPGVEPPLPANAGAGQGSGVHPVSGVSAVSCPSAGDCTAVGDYTDSSGNQQGLLLTETGGTWATGVEASLPPNAYTSPTYADLTSVSCSSPGNCTAIGTYATSCGCSGLLYVGLLLTETDGTWATGVEAPMPAGAEAGTVASVSSVSCASPGNCTAVGDGYNDVSAVPVAWTETSGTWAAGVEVSLPPDGTDGQLVSVSCSSAGNCSAVGDYDGTTYPCCRQGLAVTETDGTWGDAVGVVEPANAPPSPPLDYMSSVSCSSPGNCTAFGLMFNSHIFVWGLPLLLTETNGTWAPGAEVAMPADFVGPGYAARVSSYVSCVSAGNCVAVGVYSSNTSQLGLVLTETAGTWTGVAAPLPTNAMNPAYVEMNSVSCVPPGDCAAVGKYDDSSGSQQGLLISLSTQAQPTTTALVSSASPSAAGQPVTYTATVSPPPDGGTAAFTDNGSPIAGCGAQPVSTSTGQATCQTTPAAAGAHNITAAFNGTGSFTASTSPTLTQVVTKATCPSLAGCNLSGLNLTNAQLPGANLSGANLNGTSLSGANLTSANLSGANLKSSNLSGTNLSGANLSGANLNGANLTGANLTGANLSGANLNGANLTGANLTGAKLSGANLNKVTWSGTTCPDGTNSNTDGGTCTGHL
jgi:hypothetical protein